MMGRILSCLLAVMVFLPGCGYSTRSLLPSNYQTVYVAPLENNIDYMNQDERKLYIPNLEIDVRTAIVDRFLLDGNLEVGEEESADLILQGKLLSFDREELRLTDKEDVKEYRLRITVALSLVDPFDKQEVWREPSFSGEATYYYLTESESAAIEGALKDLAIRVVGRTVENW